MSWDGVAPVTRRVFVLAMCCVARLPALAEPRDPFYPPGLSRSPSTDARTPLQRVRLEDLRLVAILSTSETSRVLLQDQSGMGFIVGLGAAIGRNGGEIVAIESKFIVINEPGEGFAMPHEVKIELADAAPDPEPRP